MHDGIILAAGFGTRLYPITRIIPKAVFPIMGKPMVLHVMDRMSSKGIRRFYINVHYMKEKVMEVVGSTHYKGSTKFQVEKELLLTGGGLKGLLKMIETENALVHNVDIIEEFDYKFLWGKHFSDGNDITWVLTHKPGSVIIEGDRVAGFGRGGITYAGVGIYSKRIAELMPSGKFHLISWLSEVLLRKKIKMGYVMERNFWVDAGTPRGIFSACVNEIKKRKKNVILEGVVSPDIRFSGFVYVGEKVKIEGRGIIEDAIITGNSVLHGNLLIKRNILYDNLALTF